MKHLKRIFESINVDELKDLVEGHLAYLFDEGFRIDYKTNINSRSIGYLPDDHIMIIFRKYEPRTREDLNFEWDDIKDYFIPFIKSLSKKCDILDFDIFWKRPIQGTIRFYYVEKHEGVRTIANYKNFSWRRVIDDDIFNSGGYWKDRKFYKWIPDPPLKIISMIIKTK